MARASSSLTGRGLARTATLACDSRATASRSSSVTPTSRQGRRQPGARREPGDGAGRVGRVAEHGAEAGQLGRRHLGVEPHGVRQDEGVGQAVGDAGAGAEELGQPVVHAHRGVLQRPAGEGDPSSRPVRASMSSGSSTTAGSQRTMRSAPARAMASASGERRVA